MPDGTSTARQLRPKLATILREGYSLAFLRKDATAGLTVAIVALPLSMAIAVASGVGPERGLYTAIVGGFVVSALSGSRFQIGGPAGAFIVLVAATVARFGVEGLLLTVLMSGLMLTLSGALRLGSLIRHIPHAVTVGFTCGIAVTIGASQLKDLGGLRLTAPEPGPLLPKLAALASALPTLAPAAQPP
jgi:SulP family sulfate permease